MSAISTDSHHRTEELKERQQEEAGSCHHSDYVLFDI